MNDVVPSTRDRLLDAAEIVVISRGTNALTLEAVAAQAGVSKGGLLYHFHAKDDLLHAMIQRMISLFRARIDAALALEPRPPGAFTHACINALSELSPTEQSRFQRLSSALLAAITSDPRLLDPLRELYRELFAGIANDGIPPGNALVAFAIGDALWFWSIFNLPQPPAAHVADAMKIIRRLLATPSPRSSRRQPKRPTTASSKPRTRSPRPSSLRKVTQ